MRPLIHELAASRTARIIGSARLHRVIARGVALATIVATAACSNDDGPTGTGPGPVNGAFPMRTARGFAVPHTFVDGQGSKLTVEGGKLTMKPDGTFALNYKGKLNSLVFDLTDEGTVVVSGTTATFTPDDGDAVYTGKVQGKNIVVNFKIAGVMFDLGFTEN